MPPWDPYSIENQFYGQYARRTYNTNLNSHLTFWMQQHLFIIKNPQQKHNIVKNGRIWAYKAKICGIGAKVKYERNNSGWYRLTIEKDSQSPLVLPHLRIFIFDAVFAIVHNSFLITLLLTGADEKEIFCEKRKYQWQKTIMICRSFNKNVEEACIQKYKGYKRHHPIYLHEVKWHAEIGVDDCVVFVVVVTPKEYEKLHFQPFKAVLF